MPVERINLLLATLPEDERQRLAPFLMPHDFKFKEHLIEPETPITAVYFPFDAITSTVQGLENGSLVETGLTGVEGMVGIQLWLRSPTTPTLTMVQVEGTGYMMTADDFTREVMDRRDSPLNDLLAKYVHAFMSMTSQSAACNRMHNLEERLCKWLKLVNNRVRRPTFNLTQEFIGEMLGVSRPTVSIAANILRTAGLIDYVRGQVRILSATGLAEGSCECLDIMEAQFDKIYGESWRGNSPTKRPIHNSVAG